MIKGLTTLIYKIDNNNVRLYSLIMGTELERKMQCNICMVWRWWLVMEVMEAYYKHTEQS